ncbi:MAG: NHLP bacteriocin system secretion protein [Bacteroidota bacterium]
MNSNIFRKVSIDRLSSPEQLDQMLRLTSGRNWVGLSAFGALIALALVWGATGEVQTRVHGTGVLIRTGGVFDVSSVVSGRVTDVSVRPGDRVREGQVVARIEQAELADAVAQAKARVDDLRRQESEALALGQREAYASRGLYSQQRAAAATELKSARERADWLRGRIESQERLLADGLVTEGAVQNTQRELQVTLEQIERLETEREGVQSQVLADDTRRAQAATQLRLQVLQAEREVARLEGQYERSIEVTAPYTGRVLEVVVNEGDLIGPGAALARLDREGRDVQDLEAVLYISAQDGKRIRPGMRVQVAPTTFKREEFGTVVATVTSVSDFPATQEGMMRTLANGALVQSLSGGAAPYEVYASLDLDPDTPSGYRWSSSTGPNARLQSGTVATATISVEEQRPLALVIPALRRWTGIGS